MLEESYGEMISEFFSPNLLILNSNDFYCVDTVLWGTLFLFHFTQGAAIRTAL